MLNIPYYSHIIAHVLYQSKSYAKSNKIPISINYSIDGNILEFNTTVVKAFLVGYKIFSITETINSKINLVEKVINLIH